MIFTVPRHWAKKLAPFAKVRSVDAPKEFKGFSYVMAWHPRLNADPAHQWFRGELAEVAHTL
jgi:DNA-binding transcriptional LysR family regulator